MKLIGFLLVMVGVPLLWESLLNDSSSQPTMFVVSLLMCFAGAILFAAGEPHKQSR